jgi:ADP-ribose pyrophosphatase YjhB (NUDIX family)
MPGAKPSPHFTFCPHRAARLEMRDVEDHRRAVCAACGFVQFLNPAVGVAAVVRDADGRVLLARKRSGLWHFPSGYVEWDEHVRDAVIREMREEMSLDVEVGEIVAVHSNFHNRASQTVGIWFAARIVGGELRLDERELSAAEYFALDDAPPLGYPTDTLVLDQLRASPG